MNALFAAIKKEIRQLKRNVLLLVIIGASPVVIMGVIPFSMEKQVKINLSVVDRDNSAASRVMTYRVKASPFFAEVSKMPTVEAALGRLEDNKSSMVLVFPENMEREAGKPGAEPPGIVLDGTHTLNAQGHLAFLEQMLQYNLPGGETANRVHQHLLFNPTLDGRVGFIVSLLVLLVTLIGTCLITLDIVSEKESGMWEQLQATPLSPTVYIVSKMVVFAMASLFALGAGLLLCRCFFGFSVAGPWYAFWLLAVVFLWPMLTIGIGIAAVSKNQVQAVYLLVLVLLTIILMSTMFSFLNAMPAWAKAARFVNPLYFMLDASRLVALKGFSLAAVWPQVAALFMQGTVLSAVIFRRIERTK